MKLRSATQLLPSWVGGRSGGRPPRRAWSRHALVPKLGFGVMAGMVLLGLSGWAASQKDSPTPARQDYLSFKIISDRNIFNANRSRSSRGGTTEDKRTARVETFTLVGTMSYDKGPYAFFDSSSGDYRKVLAPGKSIGEYKVAEITGTGVTLEAGTNRVHLEVGEQMRREEDGPWQAVGGSAKASSSPAASSSDSAGDESDIIKRLMQQREQELK